MTEKKDFFLLFDSAHQDDKKSNAMPKPELGKVETTFPEMTLVEQEAARSSFH